MLRKSKELKGQATKIACPFFWLIKYIYSIFNMDKIKLITRLKPSRKGLNKLVTVNTKNGVGLRGPAPFSYKRVEVYQ